MKQFLMITFASLYIAVSAQSKNKSIPTIKRSQLLEMTQLSELTGALPKDQKNISYEIIGRIGEKNHTFLDTGFRISPMVKDLFEKAKINSHLYVIVKTADQKRPLKDLSFKIIE